jgi:hypothetical protein
VQIKYGALNVADYLAVRKYENGKNYRALSKWYSRNNVYEKCRHLIRDRNLASVLINYEESQFKPQTLVRMSHTRIDI